ncbi:MAG: family glycosyltransferase [Herminiimonas sp.]|nr:family glycosyltransferase [Herminiimonas sp.]MDB5855971.1 family glycosyltransferase [Herminiimonas sp.]
MAKKHIVIISPALANANNGNWQTAQRWSTFLSARHDTRIVDSHDPAMAAACTTADVVIALHARRSAAAVQQAANLRPRPAIILVLTGTDLYRDIHTDGEARAALLAADNLVLLQSAGLSELDAASRARATVIYQSAPALPPVTFNGSERFFDVCMIGHLRAEKDPECFFGAARLLSSAPLEQPPVRLTHVGAALEVALGEQALATAAQYPNYRWLGNLEHDCARQILRRSRAMVIASRMEGGANVIIEAVTSGVPVLASDISGNRGMLGEDYGGYFPAGDSAALAALISKAAQEPNFLQRLRAQCDARATLFTPEREQASLLRLIDNVRSNMPG